MSLEAQRGQGQNSSCLFSYRNALTGPLNKIHSTCQRMPTAFMLRWHVHYAEERDHPAWGAQTFLRPSYYLDTIIFVPCLMFVPIELIPCSVRALVHRLHRTIAVGQKWTSTLEHIWNLIFGTRRGFSDASEDMIVYAVDEWYELLTGWWPFRLSWFS